MEYVVEVARERMDPLARPRSGGEIAEQLPNFRRARGSFPLGGFEVEFVFAVEDAKLNVNTLLEEYGERDALRIVRSRTNEVSAGATLTWTPNAEEICRQFELPRFASAGVLWPGADPDDLASFRFGIPALLDDLTFWGSGKLRLQLATDESLRDLLHLELPADKLDALIELRARRPESKVSEISRALALTLDARVFLGRTLTDRSGSHSLWLRVRNKAREWTTLSVQQPGGPALARRQTYTW